MATQRAMHVYYQVLGGHTHLKIFTGPAGENRTLGCAGTLCMTNEVFAAWRDGTAELRFAESNKTLTDTRTAIKHSAMEANG